MPPKIAERYTFSTTIKQNFYPFIKLQDFSRNIYGENNRYVNMIGEEIGGVCVRVCWPNEHVVYSVFGHIKRFCGSCAILLGVTGAEIAAAQSERKF